MEKKRIPKSIRKFIRKEKARIRREVFDLKEQEKLINQLYSRIQPVQTYQIVSDKKPKVEKDKVEKFVKKAEKLEKPQKSKQKTEKPKNKKIETKI